MDRPEDLAQLKDEPGHKSDYGKIRWDLIPMDAMDEVVMVLTFGADKYGDRNWEKGMSWSRPLGAALRHISAFAQREDDDRETELPHLAHAACCILFLLAYQLRGMGTDDRS